MSHVFDHQLDINANFGYYLIKITICMAHKMNYTRDNAAMTYGPGRTFDPHHFRNSALLN